MLTEVVIDSIRVNLRNYQRVVVLREKDADRFLPIWIGPTEADAIAYRLQEVSVARPQTHDLLANVIEQMGGTVRSVVVSDMTNDIFIARIHVQQNDRTLEIDSRPSDAIAIAVRADAPIYVERSVLDTHAVELNADGEPVDSGDQKPGVTAEELEKLSAFTDFISSLDLDSLEQDKQGGEGGDERDEGGGGGDAGPEETPSAG